MAVRKTKVVVTRKLPEAVETRLCELFDTKLNSDDTPLLAEQLAAIAEQADVMVPTVTDQVDAAVIGKSGTGLKLIAQFGTGVDNIDLDAAQERGITVTNTAGVLTEDTADMAMALIMACPRRMIEGVRALEAGRFCGWSPTWMLGRRLAGMRLGILGMGRIGRAVARRALAFGMQIHYHNRRAVSAHVQDDLRAVYWPSLDQMLARMDVVSIHCPSTPGSYHLLNRRRLRLMKKDAYLINTARGQVVDEAALIDALEAGELAGAGLDVYEHEPKPDSRFAALPNVILLPHMGSATSESRIAMGEKVIVNIKAFVDGHRPPDRIMPRMFEQSPAPAG